MLFVVNPEIAALKAVTALVEYLNEAGTVAAKSTFVLNNTSAGRSSSRATSSRRSARKVATELPYDPFLYLKAVNEGVADRGRGAALARRPSG